MDKREAVRIPVRVRAQCKGASGVVIDGTVEDVSRSGLFMRAPESFPRGSSAEIDIDLPGEQTVHLSAEVVRVEEDASGSGIGFRFVEAPAPESRRPLANFIMKQHATHC